MSNFDEREDSETQVAPTRPHSVPTHADETPTAVAGRALRPISTFPRLPVTRTNPRYLQDRAPAWVVAYLLLCAALTLLGLVILFFEQRLLGAP